MLYIILVDRCAQALTEAVQEHIDKGWPVIPMVEKKGD